jgi:uncharacterized protein
LEPEYAEHQLAELPGEDEPAPEIEPAKRVWGFWPTVGFSLAIGFILLIVQVVVILVLAVTNLDAASLVDPVALEEYLMANYGFIMGLGTVISGILASAAIIGVIKMKKGASVKEYLGLRKLSPKTLIVIIFITLALIVAVEGLSLFIDDTVESDFDTMLYDTSGWTVLFWLALVVFAPLQEELFFRGFLFAGIRDSRLGIGGAVVITSLIWAALHVQYNLYIMGIIFAMGVVMGVVRYKTKSIWSSLIIHGAYNLAVVLVIAFGAESLFG